MTWATLTDVTTITGATPAAVTGTTTDGAGTLALAQSMVEDHVNRTEDANGGMKARDLVALKKAVAWQCAWLPGQPGILQRVGVEGVSQDGMNAQYRSPADQLIAPMAQRALKNLSWMGTRSLRTGQRAPRVPDGTFGGTSAGTFLNSGADSDYVGWSPL